MLKDEFMQGFDEIYLLNQSGLWVSGCARVSAQNPLWVCCFTVNSNHPKTKKKKIKKRRKGRKRGRGSGVRLRRGWPRVAPANEELRRGAPTLGKRKREKWRVIEWWLQRRVVKNGGGCGGAGEFAGWLR